MSERLIPLTVTVPSGIVAPEIVNVIARWFTPGGLIAVPPQGVPFQQGLPLPLVIQLFVQALNAGVVQQLVTGPDGEKEIKPVTNMHFVVVPPKRETIPKVVEA